MGGASDNDYECQQHFSQIIQESANILESIVGSLESDTLLLDESAAWRCQGDCPVPAAGNPNKASRL